MQLSTETGQPCLQPRVTLNQLDQYPLLLAQLRHCIK